MADTREEYSKERCRWKIEEGKQAGLMAARVGKGKNYFIFIKLGPDRIRPEFFFPGRAKARASRTGLGQAGSDLDRPNRTWIFLPYIIIKWFLQL